jgi:hypothetical protein
VCVRMVGVEGGREGGGASKVWMGGWVDGWSFRSARRFLIGFPSRLACCMHANGGGFYFLDWGFLAFEFEVCRGG